MRKTRTRRNINGYRRTAWIVAWRILLFAPGASVARAGFVFFDPESAVLDIRESPEPVTFDLYLRAFLPGIEQFRVLVGSDSVPFMDFVAADEQFSWNLGTFAGVYSHGLLVEGATGELFPFPPELYLGRLTVHVADLAEGEHRIVVDWAYDGGISQGSFRGLADPLIGVATIRVVPEPPSAILLLAGSAAVFLRRRW